MTTADPAAGLLVGATTRDALLGGRVIVRQPRFGYRVGVDPVLLAAFTPAVAGSRVLDAGAGGGAAALCLAVRTPGCVIDCLERQPEAADFARFNIETNGMQDRLRVIDGDLADPPDSIAPGAYDLIMTNPPFFAAHRGPASSNDMRRAARTLAKELDRKEWLGACLRLLRPKGWFCTIQRTDWLDETLSALSERVGAIEILPLWPRAGRPAKLALLRGRSQNKAPLTLHPGLTLHAGSGYTAEAERILVAGVALAELDRAPGCETVYDGKALR